MAQPLRFGQIGFAAAQRCGSFHQSRFAFREIAIQKGVLGHVHQRSDNLEIAGRIFQDAAQHMHELDRTVRHQQTVRNVEILFAARCFVNKLTNDALVGRTRCSTRSIVGLILGSYSNIRKVSSDQ